MAITTYENHIPPSLEHLIWGGGRYDNAFVARCYIGGRMCIKHPDYGHYIGGLVYFNNDFVCTATPISSSYFKILRYAYIELQSESSIMESDEVLSSERCTTDEYNYICDTLPESWLLALNIGSSIYKYRLR